MPRTQTVIVVLAVLLVAAGTTMALRTSDKGTASTAAVKDTDTKPHLDGKTDPNGSTPDNPLIATDPVDPPPPDIQREPDLLVIPFGPFNESILGGLACSGNNKIKVMSANYQVVKGTCQLNSAVALQKLSAKANDNQVAVFTMNNAFYGNDPCPGAAKQTTGTYQCIPGTGKDVTTSNAKAVSNAISHIPTSISF